MTRLHFPMHTSPDLTVLCNRFWPDLHGGVEQRLWHMSRALAARGLHVRVMTANRTGALPLEMLSDRIEVIRWAPCDPGRLWRFEPVARLRWWHRCLAEIHTGGRIWATDPPSALAAARVAGRGNLFYNPAACVAAMRRVVRHHPHVDTLRCPRLLAVMDQRALRRAAAVIVASRNLAAQYASTSLKGPAPRILPHGVVAPAGVSPAARLRARRTWQIPDTCFVAGFVGRLDPCKDLEFLFEAMRRVPPGRPWRIILAGTGPDRLRLEEAIRRRTWRNRVMFLGHLDDPACAFAAMDALVLPSVYEAFGNVLPEAMVHGVPVLARASNGRSVLTAADEIITHGLNGFVSDGTDPADLGCHLRALAVAPGLAGWMGANARKAWLPRTWDRYAREVCDAIGLGARAVPTRIPAPPTRRAA